MGSEDTSNESSEPPERRPGVGPDHRVRDLVRIEVADASGRLSVAEAGWLRAKAGEAVAQLGASGEVRVRVVVDEEMADLHERYAGTTGTTDVLTFDLGDGHGSLDVDIVVCVDEAEREAAARGHGRDRELLLYVLHGVLHAMGHDDHDDDGYAAMHEKEDLVLKAIGVGSVFESGAVVDAGPHTDEAPCGRDARGCSA